MKWLFTLKLATASWGKGWFMRLERLRLLRSLEREEDIEELEENGMMRNAGLKDQFKKLRY